MRHAKRRLVLSTGAAFAILGCSAGSLDGDGGELPACDANYTLCVPNDTDVDCEGGSAGCE